MARGRGRGVYGSTSGAVSEAQMEVLASAAQGPVVLDMRRANALVKRRLLHCITPPGERWVETVYVLTKKGQEALDAN